MHTRYHGIDFHARRMTIDTIDPRRGILHEKKTICIENYVSEYLPHLDHNTVVCLETLNGSFEFARRIRPYVKNVYVVHAADIRTSTKKTDKVDAQKLASKLMYALETGDRSEFNAVYIPERHVSDLRSLYATDALIKKQMTMLANRIHALFKSELIALDKEVISLRSFMENIDKSTLSSCAKVQVRLCKKQYDTLCQYRVELEDEIVRIAHKYFDNEIRLLLTIPGVSVFLACSIMADVADIRRFKNSKHFTSYLRSTPKIRSSGETIHDGRTTKRGRKISYSLALQGIQHLIKSSEKCNRFYQEKTVGKKPTKVRAALVRKMFEIIFYMLKNEEPYRWSIPKMFERKLRRYEGHVKRLSQAA